MNEPREAAVDASNDEQEQVEVWSIGIYEGPAATDLRPARGAANPVVSARDVTDVRAEFVADPFMIQAGPTWHMFFEVFRTDSEKGEIGWATSDDGRAWSYRRIVLAEPFHLSYPGVYVVDGEHYMVPEAHRTGTVMLYRARRFPEEWSPVGPILEGRWVDPSLFFFEGAWWMFASPASPTNDRLDLFYASRLEGPWHAHAMNPIVSGNGRMARPGGRVVVLDGGIIRFTQDCQPWYGTQVRAFQIDELTRSTYREREVTTRPVLTGGEAAWSETGMHHVDAHRVDGGWLACVDGWRFEPWPGDVEARQA